ncbi:S8 family peptidase [Kribbella sp. NPDC051952]|uniref:S8 family peptidase n=1 Tax=Kribbella sp. NPDC051952 TaxID=3154851 RepID=UPI003439EF46
MGLRKRKISAGIAAITAAVLAVPLASGAQAAQSPEQTTKTAKPSADKVITLITGDRVVLRNGDSKQVTVKAGKGREHVSFRISRVRGRLSVVPLDVSSAVTSGRFDRRLFDVTGLLEMQYDDAHTGSIPVLVDSTGPSARSALPEATIARDLPALGVTALKVDKNATGAFFSGARTRSAPATVWLDAKRRTMLDQSVPQIGAPAAWKAGFTGKGVRVAVVDTGIDATHPDFKGQIVASKNFTTDPAGDGFGHGTHVASTIAGTAAASQGKYKGVAPDAKLVDAKVCDNEGGCEDSAILAGMEWAAVQQKARVINLSLGGPDEPGLDPMETAVNRLTAQTGALFVIAAGNEGPDAGTVSSPGSAASALTVGAVDKKDALADFSSRGPLVDGTGIKPDLTAPGVGIVAARAKNAQIGEPVGQYYLSLEGTSMATPHVAGSAAILLQEHPSWKASELKAALMGTAKPIAGQTAYEQGAGRVDVAHAITDTVVAEPGSLGFGTALWPHTDDNPVAKKLAYRNLGTKSVTLSLQVSSTPAPAFRLSATSLTIPAGGSASVTVTSDTRHDGPDGQYFGRVVATAPGVNVGTPVVVTKEVESYDIDVKHLLPNGKGTDRNYTIVYGLDHELGLQVKTDAQGNGKLRLPKGRYLVDGIVGDSADRNYQLVWPNLVLDHTTHLAVDARKTKPIAWTLPRKGTELVEADFGYYRKADGYLIDGSMSTTDVSKLYVGSMGAPAPGDDLISWTSSRWVVPGKAGDPRNAPYSYNLVQSKRGSYYTGYRRVVRENQLATVRAQYTGDHPGTIGADEQFAWIPGVEASTPGIPIEYDLPATSTQFFETKDVAWDEMLTYVLRKDGAESYPLSLSTTSPKKFRAGRTYSERWGAAVANTGFGLGDGSTRKGNELTIFMFPVSDQDGHAGTAISTDSESTRLYRDGELLANSDAAGQLWIEKAPAEKASYRLEVSMRRAQLQLASRVEHVWTFTSQDTGKATEVLPLREIEFRPVVDGQNSVERKTVSTLPFAVVHQPGAKVAGIRSVSVQVSGDGGRTWQSAIVVPKGDGTYAAVFKTPAAKVISLRSSVADRAGTTATQTVFGAYRIR